MRGYRESIEKNKLKKVEIHMQMDIAALSMQMASMDLATNVNLSVMRMSRDSMEQQGQDISQLISSGAVPPMMHPNSTFDISV